MKYTNSNLLIKNIFHNKIALFINFILIVYLIKISPSFFFTLEVDSLSYIEKSSSRFSLYPQMINFFGTESLNTLINFQIFIFSFSLVFLSFAIAKLRIKIFLIIIFQSFILINFLYTSFCKVVLTESIFFSSINFILGLILLLDQTKKKSLLFFLLGLALGSLIAIKPEGLVLLTGFLFYIIFFKKSNTKEKMILFVGIAIMPLFENIFYYEVHQKRETVFKHVVKGKVFMIAGKSGEKFMKLPYFSDGLKKKIISKSFKVQEELSQIDNFYIRSKFLVDYEVLAQTKIKNILPNSFPEFNDEIEKNYLSIYFNLIYLFPVDYLKLTLNHYFMVWHPGVKILLKNEINKIKSDISFYEAIKTTSGNVKQDLIFEEKKILSIFSVLFLIYIIFSLYSLTKIFRSEEIAGFISYLILLTQFHLIAVSLTNIGNFRYLLPNYSIIVLSVILLINLYLNKKINTLK